MTVNSFRTARRDAGRYERSIAKLGDQSGSGAHIYHTGTLVTMHSNAPPPVEEYEAWLAEEVSKDPRGKTKLDGRKLRRMVVMRRNGCAGPEIGRVVNLSPNVVTTWLAKLPEELRP